MNELPKENDRISAPASGTGGENHFEQQKQAWQSQPFLTEILNAVPEIILVLNSSKQIVFANDTFLISSSVCSCTTEVGRALRAEQSAPRLIRGAWPARAMERAGHQQSCPTPGNMDDFATIVQSQTKTDINRFFGDIPGCQHALEEGGCGMTHFCRTCGGLKAIETGLRGTRDVQECRILTRSGDALDLQVTAVPVDLGADRYVICTISDISSQKRRRALERLFFHDVTNTAIGVRDLADMLMEAEGEKAAEIRDMIVSTAATLVEQIQGQRLLTMAENKDLTVSILPIDSLNFLRGILAKWQEEGEVRHLKLVVNSDSMSVRFLSDETILSHVLNNMVKNAFEASLRGMEIALGCYVENQTVVFRVRNSTVMTEDVQLQVFQRSFSTRGSGRGLGTYSMKLLTEQYLGGKVGFSSGGSDGTMFYVRLQLSPPGVRQA